MKTLLLSIILVSGLMAGESTTAEEREAVLKLDIALKDAKIQAMEDYFQYQQYLEKKKAESDKLVAQREAAVKMLRGKCQDAGMSFDEKSYNCEEKK